MQIQELIRKIQKDFESNLYDKFIHEINFPKYKNFSPNEKIIFNFPVSIIVGPNGGGKSSVLHALWGMPLNHSTSRFWFSTPIDPIDSENNKDRNRYWYTHYIKELNQIVQCRKISGEKRNGYWEPSRPSSSDGMTKPPKNPTTIQKKYLSKSFDRWNQVEKTPIYINNKAESSAFERFFYYTDGQSLEKKQNQFLRYSKKLKNVIDNNLQSITYYSIQRNIQNFLINEKSLKEINKILGKDYISAKYIIHDLYGKIKSPSVVFETTKRKYSECFAGSGELAVVNTVLAIEKLNTYDLLLLDEPETSLHPGAQKRLIEYILKTTLEKKIQVVISTHSPTLVELLPDQALIVLDESSNGVTSRKQPTKYGAFKRLESPNREKILIIAEDPLLASIVEIACKKLNPDYHGLIEIAAATVGASEMLSNQVRAYSLAKNKVLMVLDGDQKPIKNIYDQDHQLLNKHQKDDLIIQLKKLNVSLVGGDDFFAQWCDWCKKNVIFLEETCPEKILIMCIDSEHKILKDSKANNQKYKDVARSLLKQRSLGNKPENSATVLKTLLTFNSPESSPQIKVLHKLTQDIEEKLKILSSASGQ